MKRDSKHRESSLGWRTHQDDASTLRGNCAKRDQEQLGVPGNFFPSDSIDNSSSSVHSTTVIHDSINGDEVDAPMLHSFLGVEGQANAPLIISGDKVMVDRRYGTPPLVVRQG